MSVTLKNIADGINKHFPNTATIDENGRLSLIISAVTLDFDMDGKLIGAKSKDS